jgi:O-antigen ligase
MVDPPKIATSSPPGHRLRSVLSLLSLGLALALLAGTYFLISPPSDAGYPGAIPWRPGSLLKGLTGLMSLNGSVATVRGVEIKDLAFHLATTLALVLLAARALVSGLLPSERRTVKGAWFFGQVFLTGWVFISLASSQWSGDADLSWGQAALYGLALAWAVVLAWSLEGRDVPRLLWGYLIIAAMGAALCVWHFHERNPYHRPGFPIGNPAVLAACILPAILVAGAVAIGSVWGALQQREALAWPRVIGAAAALIPLCWCFGLANSRAAWIGLIVGIAGVAFLRARRRVRWGIVAALVLLGSVGAWYLSSTEHDFAMARGATIRFRLYAWRYAVVLWSGRPVSGMGAGSYPRLANALSVHDRTLDPAAFMNEVIGHAHNELFEVLAEIGLVGGVTFVGGFLATLMAASALLRTSLSPQRRWLLYGLVASVIGLLADAMFGVGLRLPGLPAVFFTLLGALWAVCRSISKEPSSDSAVAETWLRRMVVRRYGLAATALLAAFLGGWLTFRNWSGVRHEQAAAVAYRDREHETALHHLRAAQRRLLNPVQKLTTHKYSVEVEADRARAAYRQAIGALDEYEARRQENDDTVGASGKVQELLPTAEARCRGASEVALDFSRRAPNFGRMAALGAECAEMLATLRGRVGDGKEARAWSIRALQAWRSQRAMRPYDVQTLLALTRYPTLVDDYIGLLRNALRHLALSSGSATVEASVWRAALESGSTTRGFERTLTAMVQAVGPYDPQTDLDNLILSGAPEMYRLHAAWLALQGDHESAAGSAARAALLYEPMRARFPTLYSIARAEQADYVFQAQPDEPRNAIALVRDAIYALPAIQPQKYEEMARPYRLRLARFLLAAGEDQEADEILREVLRQQPTNLQAWMLTAARAIERGDVEAVRAILHGAEAAGVRGADLEALRNLVKERLPDVLQGPEGQPERE